METQAKHYTLPPLKTGANRWAVGDVHGHAKTLEHLVLQEMQLQKEDQLILLGDLVDRGPDAKGVFDFIFHLKEEGFQVHCVRGNHDDLMLDSWIESLHRSRKGIWIFKGPAPITANWLAMGGDETLMSFDVKRADHIDEKYAQFLEEMPHFIASEKHLFVHAGFDFSLDSIYENVEAMMWIRDYKVDLEKTQEKIIVHGHTPVSRELIESCIYDKREGFIPLDNGIYLSESGKGKLVAHCINSGKTIFQPNIG